MNRFCYKILYNIAQLLYKQRCQIFALVVGSKTFKPFDVLDLRSRMKILFRAVELKMR